ncbi:MAG: hypothetical protein ACLGGX_10120 [Bdellovibrionia bacterium]
MAWLMVLENDDMMFRLLKEGLDAVDPNLEIKRFRQVKELLGWLMQLEKKEPEIIAQIPNSKFKGLITEIEGWGFKDITLIQKLKPLFVKLGYAENEEEICILLTGHDHPKLILKRYEHRFVNNFIFKPFDKLLLIQTLETAFNGRLPVKKYHINNFKTSAQIEMLKEIKLSEINEAGFSTLSDQEVKSDVVAKYYADFLETSQHRSAFGRSLNCTKILETQMFRVELGFFALDQQQSFNLQKLIREQNNQRPYSNGTNKNSVFVFIGHESSNLTQQLEPSIERFFSGETQKFKNVAEFNKSLESLDPSFLIKQYFVFLDSSAWLGNEINETISFKNMHQDYKLKIFLLSARIFNEKDEKELIQHVEDIYYAPFNRAYIIKGIKARWRNLQNKEEIFTSYGQFEKTIFVSNPVELKEVSEAGVVLRYYRELPVGTFREFIFWMPNEVDIPEIVGQCNYVEYDKEAKSYNCHFVFFGMRDFHLKHIRLWILQNYIESKKEDK